MLYNKNYNLYQLNFGIFVYILSTLNKFSQKKNFSLEEISKLVKLQQLITS